MRLIRLATVLFLVPLVSFAAQRPVRLGSLIQTAELIASNGLPSDQFGTSIAKDGDTVVVGANNSNSNRGSAYVFVESATGWSQVAELTASDGRGGGDGFGQSVAISGNIIVVGSPGHYVGSHQGQGSVYVFAKPTGGWIDATETAKLTTSDGSIGDNFGYSVSVSGSTVAAGALDNGNTGAIYIFTKPPTGWTSSSVFTAKLTDSDSHEGQLGRALSIQGDTVFAGAGGDSVTAGAIYVFVRPPTGWVSMTESATLKASDAQANNSFGWSLSANPTTVVAGSTIDVHGNGAAYVFVKLAGGWVNAMETAKLTPSGGSAITTVAISGTVVVLGASQLNNLQGIAYVVLEPPSGWVTTSKYDASIFASDGTATALFGGSLAAGGATIAVGSHGWNSYQGSAYIFTAQPGR